MNLKLTKEQKAFCEAHKLTLNQFFGIDKIEGNLNLRSLTIIPAGFNPTVGGDLDLRSLTRIPAGFNPTVGGTLYLSSLTSNYTKLPENYVFSWQEGKYIKVDGIFVEVVSKRGKVYRVKKVHSDKVFYVVTDGEKFSHGDTIKEAKESLIYKITNRDKSRFEGLKQPTVLSFPEMIECYRVITGACEFGVRNFIKSKLGDKVKDKYSIKDIIKLTNGEYGNDTFKSFFAK